MKPILPFLLLALLGAGPQPEKAPDRKLWTELPERSEPRAVPELVKGSMGAVVAIFATQAAPEPPAGGGHGALGQLMDNEPAEGLGTGFLIHKEGYILTNAHVVSDAVEIRVLIGPDRRSHSARIVGKDDATDIALLKVDFDKPLPVLPLGDSEALRVGDAVVAIGNPFGLSQSVTSGIVSFKGRRNVSPTEKDGTYFDFIQTDASINPGSSGGPLLNAAGEVVGINAAITQQGQGIGFAVPINMAKEILPALMSRGKVSRAYVGVVVHDLDDVLASSFGLRESRGAVVSEVAEKSPAQKAGLAPGDVVLEFQGRRIDDAMMLRWMAANAGVGTEVEMTVQRGGKPRRLKVVLAEPPGAVALADEPLPAPRRARDADPAGLVLGEDKEASGMAGVKVSEIDPSGAAYGAVEKGDLLVEVNGENVASAKEFESALGKVAEGALVRVYLRRDGEMRYVAFKKTAPRG